MADLKRSAQISGAVVSCRRDKGAPITHKQIIELLGSVESAGFDFIKTENLCNFDGERGYSLDQGE